MNKITIISILFLIIPAIVAYTNAYSHENVHKQIAIYNGCDSYKISYFPLPYFLCYHYDHSLSDEEIKTEYMLDSLNEIVGYNISTIFISIFICAFIICFCIIDKGEMNGNKEYNC